MSSINFFSSNGKCYLVSGGFDSRVKIWDYRKKEGDVCVTSLAPHSNHVVGVWHHPTLPLIVSASRDHAVCFQGINK